MDRPTLKEYLHWDERTVSDLSPASLDSLYQEGFIATRKSKGVFHQTRSVRIELAAFTPSSENRRVLKKGEEAGITLTSHPIPYTSYDWHIGKLAKDFYDTKAGAGTFSANKVKELLTASSHFNTLLEYKNTTGETLGYSICIETPTFLHYCYPFYDLSKAPKDMGLVMMTQAVLHAQKLGQKYVYLGSLQRPSDVYKLQFSGIQWFDGKAWKQDVEEVKGILKQ